MPNIAHRTQILATRRALMRSVVGVAGLSVLGAGQLALAQSAAQKYPITAQQRARAQKAASNGVPVSELVPNAPSRHIVKKGDTLWGISAKFLKRPWRWPELWGMNLQQIKNPHLIYPGQVLWLDIKNGRARLRTGKMVSTSNQNVDVRPQVRVEDLPEQEIPAIPPHMIEPFLIEAIILNEDNLNNAPRIVGSRDDGRQLFSKGDRVYAIGPSGERLVNKGSVEANTYRIFRNPRPIKDPATKEVLGYEAEFVGRAELARSETTSSSLDGGKPGVPEAAKLDVISSKSEIRVGDRLLPEPERELLTYVPHAPEADVQGMVASIYDISGYYAGQRQVVAINRGTSDGVMRGDVLALISTGRRIRDKSNNGQRVDIKLPDERNGLLYIFRPFERISYGLVMEIQEPVTIGDRVENPVLPADGPEPPYVPEQAAN